MIAVLCEGGRKQSTLKGSESGFCRNFPLLILSVGARASTIPISLMPEITVATSYSHDHITAIGILSPPASTPKRQPPPCARGSGGVSSETFARADHPLFTAETPRRSMSRRPHTEGVSRPQQRPFSSPPAAVPCARPGAIPEHGPTAAPASPPARSGGGSTHSTFSSPTTSTRARAW